jgi:hypothetical protein
MWFRPPPRLPPAPPHAPADKRVRLTRIPHIHTKKEEDEDLVLAKALQEQEAALAALAAGGAGGAGGLWALGGSGGLVDAGGDGPASPSAQEAEDDAAFAARLQAEEDRANLLALAGLGPAGVAGGTDGGADTDAAGPLPPFHHLLEGTDPSALSYEQLNALGEIAGSGPRGADAGVVAALPTETWGCGEGATATDPDAACCVICQCEYAVGDTLARLGCGHAYHAACVAEALAVRKACPLCGKDVE